MLLLRQRKEYHSCQMVQKSFEVHCMSLQESVARIGVSSGFVFFFRLDSVSLNGNIEPEPYKQYFPTPTDGCRPS